MAIVITASEVQALSLTGEFDQLTADQIDPRIASAILKVNEELFAECAKEAASHLAAHYLAVAMKSAHGAPAGPVEASAAGGLSRSYAVEGAAQGDPDRYLNSTWYGRHFLWIRRTRAIGPTAVNTADAGLRILT